MIRLRYIVKVPFHRRTALSRRAVFARDDHRCQYCGGTADSIDHIMPRSRGGQHIWENVAAACRPCNLSKRDRTPDEAGMRWPARAVTAGDGMGVVSVTRVPEAWKPYLAVGVLTRLGAARHPGRHDDLRRRDVRRYGGESTAATSAPTRRPPCGCSTSPPRPSCSGRSSGRRDRRRCGVRGGGRRGRPAAQRRRRRALEPGAIVWFDVVVPTAAAARGRCRRRVGSVDGVARLARRLGLGRPRGRRPTSTGRDVVHDVVPLIASPVSGPARCWSTGQARRDQPAPQPRRRPLPVRRAHPVVAGDARRAAGPWTLLVGEAPRVATPSPDVATAPPGALAHTLAAP